MLQLRRRQLLAGSTCSLKEDFNGFQVELERVKEAKKETGLSGDEIRQIAQDLELKILIPEVKEIE